MPSNRPNLTLDQQFFQELLSAAYTIQQHNERLDQAEASEAAPEAPAETKPDVVCANCGASRPADESQCARCGPDPLRPGERMQRKWASMWLMSQEQGLFPERSLDQHGENGRDKVESGKDERGNDAPGNGKHFGGERGDAAHAQTSNAKTSPLTVKRAPKNSKALDLAASGIVAAPLENSVDKETNSPKPNGSSHLRGNGNGAGLKDRSKGSAPKKFVRDQAAHEQFPHDDGISASNWRLEASDEAVSSDFMSAGLHHDDLPHEHGDLHHGDLHLSDKDAAPEASDLVDESFDLPEGSDAYLAEADWSEGRAGDPDSSNIMLDYEAEKSLFHRVADWRVKLRFHRADVYLGTAIVVAALALLWPTAGSPQATLSLWQKTLVTLGIAEVPQPAMHVQGDPAVEVWIDPHTALYYCPGEEQYGKARDGHFTSQREAQMDRFEPAGRSACE